MRSPLATGKDGPLGRKAGCARVATRVALGLGLAVLAAGAILMAVLKQGSLYVPAPQARYVPIVARIRSLYLAAGERRRFRLVDPADPATLREDTSRYGPMIGQGAGTVWAERDAAGRLLVAIETVDHGHAGEFGYLYAEAGALGSEGRDSSVDGPGPEWTLDRYWGDGWWSVSYRLG
jgi:hypothetical protein